MWEQKFQNRPNIYKLTLEEYLYRRESQCMLEINIMFEYSILKMFFVFKIFITHPTPH